MEIPVLDLGHVSLEGFCGSDLDIVNAARVSFNKRHEIMEEGDDKLISFLMKNRHGTPFEMAWFKFRVKAPIFVFREWHRHRIASINEWSARYSELKDDFYVPRLENVRKQIGKPGHYKYIQADKDLAFWFTDELADFSKKAFQLYKEAIARGVAKEQARFFLPVNIFSEMYWAVNARALMNFLSLRNSPKAMWEIREYAKVLEGIFAEHMPVTACSFVLNERVAP